MNSATESPPQASAAAVQPRPTASQIEQWTVEKKVFEIYDLFATIPPKSQTLMLEVQRDKHMEYLTGGLRQLSPAFVSLDANRPWICYWILNSIALLGESVDEELENNAIDFLNRCQDPNGGYGGGPGQLPHLATTYAAVNSLVTLGGEKALTSINRGKLYSFLRQMKDGSGAFRMHDAGEIDVRACYTAISVASILNILDDELTKGVGDYILSCQTYEGGIAGEPGSEAHGGYTFCGLAAMILINELNRLDLAALTDWVVFRQGGECGFQGRTNKLVDGCYSFWQGGVLALLQRLNSVSIDPLAFPDAGEGEFETHENFEEDDDDDDDEGSEGNSSEADESHDFEQGAGQQNASSSADCSSSCWTKISSQAETEPLFHSMALQQYIILCSQEQEGGFRDKPGKRRDYYHTCYCLSGLSLCQYSWSKNENSPPLPRAVLGPYSNLLEPINPLYGIVLSQCREAHQFFSRS